MAENHLKTIQRVREDYQIEYQDLELEIHERLKKIDSISNASLFALYYKLLGRKDEALDSYKDHYLALTLRYHEIGVAIKSIEYEIQIVKNKVDLGRSLKTKLQKVVTTAKIRFKQAEYSKYATIVKKK